MPFSIGSLKPGKAIIFNDELYIITGCTHVKLGRGPAFCKAKLRNFKTGLVVEHTLRDSDKVEEAFIEKRTLQFSYSDGDIFHFMDMETYEDRVLDRSVIGDRDELLKDNLELTGLFYQDALISFELPSNIEMKVVETTPGAKGDTVKMATKQARLETGLVLQVPLFIESGETIKINTETREYLGRA